MRQLLIGSACMLWFTTSPALATQVAPFVLNAAPISTDGSDPKTWDVQQDGVLVAPQSHRIIYEDDEVRVQSVTIPGGTEEPYHLHPYWSVLVNVAAVPANTVNRDASGKETSNWTFADVLTSPVWIAISPPGATHSIKNIGATSYRLIRVEFKKDTVPKLIRPDWLNSKPPISSDGSDPATWDTKLAGPIAAPTIHKIVFEDANIAVEAVSTPAGATEPMHAHRYSAVKIDYSDLPTAPRVELMAPIPPHPGRNTTTRATRIILIDFKHGFSEPTNH